MKSINPLKRETEFLLNPMITHDYFVEYKYTGNAKDFPDLDSDEASKLLKLSNDGKALVDPNGISIALISLKSSPQRELIDLSKCEYITPVVRTKVFLVKLSLKLKKNQLSELLLSGKRLGKQIRSAVLSQMKNYYKNGEPATRGIGEEIMNSVVKYDINSKELTPNAMKNSKDKIRLYAYQRENIKWMCELENKIAKKEISFEFSNNQQVKIDDNLVFSVPEGRFYKGDIKTCRTFVSGGGLIDGVGTGKTLSMIGLILKNPDKINRDDEEVNEGGEPPEKRRKLDKEKEEERKSKTCIAMISKVVNGKRVAYHCTAKIVDKEKKMCGRHAKVENPIIDENYYADLTSNEVNTEYPLRFTKDGFPKSRATLIIVPPNLYKQWKFEINTKLNPKPQVVGISTVNEFQTVTYGDLLCADIVVISTNFFDNNILRTIAEEYSLDGSIEDAKRNCAFEISNNKNLFEQTLPLLNVIHWHRVVLDEAHEDIGDETGHQFIFNFLMSLETNFRWYMSATPFVKVSALKNFASWISSSKDREAINEIIRNSKQLFRRNTDESIKEEFQLPPLEEETLWLNFSKQERDIYTSFSKSGHSRELIRQLCCHLKICDRFKDDDIEECKTIEDIHKHLIGGQIERVECIRKELREIDLSLATAQNAKTRYERQGMRHLVVEESRKIAGLKERKKNRETLLQREESTMRFLNSTMEQIEKMDEDQECGICADEIDTTDMGMTKCGHIFCYSCLQMCVKTVPRCGYCQTPLSGRDFWKVEKENMPPPENVTEVSKNHTEEMKELEEMISIHGTKMAHLVRYIKKALSKSSEKIIVFSYYDNMLRLVKQTLEAAQITTILCAGNVNCRNKAINDFKYDSRKRVILLSAEHSASGANLTQANRIIVIEPLEAASRRDTEIWAEEIENQIIGRAYRMGQQNIVRTIRLLIRNTIEEEIHVYRFGKEAAPPKGNKEAKVLKYVNNEDLLDQYKNRPAPMEIDLPGAETYKGKEKVQIREI